MGTAKRALATLLLFVFALGGIEAAAQTNVVPVQPPEVGTTAGILVEMETGKILWARNDEMPRPPASLTKILTALVVLEHVKLNKPVVITREARYVDGGRIYAEEGWTFSAEDLMWGLLLQSGNDAAIALAQKASPDGGVAGFAKLMNERAAALGARQTNFLNPHGLDEPGHVTSPRDLALIAAAAMRNKDFASMVATKSHDIKWGDGSARTMINGNKMLSRYPGAIGIKTGFTNEAGKALASAVRRDSKTLLAIVLDSPDHYQDSIGLYDWGFTNLPALLASPIGVMRPVDQKAPAPKDAPRGLEVIQFDPSAQAKPEESSAPLVIPLLVLGAVIVAGRRIRERFRPRKETGYAM